MDVAKKSAKPDIPAELEARDRPPQDAKEYSEWLRARGGNVAAPTIASELEFAHHRRKKRRQLKLLTSDQLSRALTHVASEHQGLA